MRGAVDTVDCGVAFLCFMLLPLLRHFVTPLLKERFFVWLPLRGAVDAVDCGAVSYTHLDVYKRQPYNLQKKMIPKHI